MAKKKNLKFLTPSEVKFQEQGRILRQQAKFRQPRAISQEPVLSKGQILLQEMFNSNQRTWGTGQNLPKIDHILTSGNGLVKNGDDGETGRMFGI